ncbi:MAG: 1-deoxy-D-xylulose-5-phosphate synthase [Thermoleophilia bacterium]|nr:1-deoxy-D-xylulose-5-phosphate synthase [Thermoleophilia bacterium]MDH4345250.1 1-deoxy-D-xylulose-5-phosphate synthase [Thermoleophilia bacterium]MDH5333847.1 1-deoxy-D-xylulose-5-phosphate synthase [Thermoleophilia bacterium]
MLELTLVPRSDFERVSAGVVDPDARILLLADMCRLNALTAVKRAGSGHLGSSFSAMDIVAFLYFEQLSTATLGWEHPDRDIVFSSKGHDVPGTYAALHALGAIPDERLLRLRRLGGLDGHPDVGVPGIEANSGSLGMGLSKGRGMAWAKRHLGRGGRVVVITGDGELQEGQNYEGLQGAAHDRLASLIAVVDRNELQSDRPTEEILALGDVEAKLRAFGWHVLACDGHDPAALRAAFAEMRDVDDRPHALVARTIKGRGVSFMEHPAALAAGGGMYRWHAGAPGDDDFVAAHAEIVARIDARLAGLDLDPVALVAVPPLEPEPAASLEGEPVSGAGAAATRPRVSDEYVAEAYGAALLELVERDERIVVLDADLASDCRVRGVELAVPDRFVETGIAEQDMVSMAGGLARQGLLPVVNSFASFLASRANEQVYNNASEGTRIVYALHYAGLIPAGPGKSHQSLRDVSLLAALPNMDVVQPVNAEETRMLLEWALTDAPGNVAIRLAIGPSPRRIELPAGYRPSPGRALELVDGDAALVLCYGPVLTHEALVAAEALRARGVRVAVSAMPWLNRVDEGWLAGVAERHSEILVVEDHAPVGALGDALLRAIAAADLPRAPRVAIAGVEGWPACGTPPEALRAHRLDGASLAARILRALERDRPAQ